ncbi:MAG: SDR family oxidoreductase [Fimbriimonadales bacterium]
MTVIVTGASSGIGRAVALDLHGRGINTVLSGRNEERLSEISDKCDKARWVAGDVSDPAVAQKLFDALPEGRIGAVFAAGVADFGSTTTFEDEKWRAALDANLNALYYCCKSAITEMLTRGGGRIVNVLSIAAIHPFPQSAAYVASKAGALGLTRSLQAEFRSQGIEITAFIPGSTATELWDRQAWSPSTADMIEPDDLGRAISDVLLSESSGVYDEVVYMPKRGIL